jgi:hypothetical protein
MAELTRRARPRPKLSSTLFTVAIFTSAMLVFLVEPMIAKMLLPRLGGSPAVWNASMAFFQTALLLGYGYAHLLQRLPSLDGGVRQGSPLAARANGRLTRLDR